MLIRRQEALDMLAFLKTLDKKKFDINLQYKLIKIMKALKEEQEIYQEQIMLNCSQFFELDSFGSPLINEDGGYKVKKDKIIDCQNEISKINKCKVQINDTYFTTDELEPLDLTFEELAVLEPFIKN